MTSISDTCCMMWDKKKNLFGTFFFLRFIFLNSMYVCMFVYRCVTMSANACRGRSFESLGTRVLGNCVLPDVGAGN